MDNQPIPKTITYSQIIDLSHIIDPQIPQWPEDPPVELETAAEIETNGYYLRRFSMGEHSATHINAPNSFFTKGTGIDTYSPASLVLPAVVIDIRDTIKNPDYLLSTEDILNWEKQFNKIPTGSAVLLYTGWQEKWTKPAEFLNNMHFPGFAPETTKFLLEKRGIAGVGIDTHGVDGCDSDYSTNKQILQQRGIVLENLTNLHLLPPTGTTLVIGILRLRGGSGSPASVLGFVP